MRLTIAEVKTIIENKTKVFGVGAKIYLFGSRVDDNKKGGDIDLFIEVEKTGDELKKKLLFINKLNYCLGEQKIDVIIAKDKTKKIEIEARKTGIELTIENIRLEKYFKQCDKHIQRIDEASEDMQGFMPLTVVKYQQLTRHEVQAIDQYIFRFSKLQDTMGENIFKLIVQIYEQSENVLPFIDLLNKLEKYGFLISTKEWLVLRKLRNEIAHQYDDEPVEMTQAINLLFDQKEIIKSAYSLIKEKI